MTAARPEEGISYSDLPEVLVEARGGSAREGVIARCASHTCDAWQIPDAPLTVRLVGLALRGGRQAPLPPISQGEILDLCVWVCACHGIPADDDLPFRLGILTGRAP